MRARGVVAVLMLAACSEPPSPSTRAGIPRATVPPIEQSRWSCADGRVFQAAFYAGPDRVEIGDGPVKTTLLLAESEAGALYEGAGVSFQTKDGQGLFTSAAGATLCRRADSQE